MDDSIKKKQPVVKDEPSADLHTQLEAAQAKSAEHLAGWQRATADYQNLQKETVEDRKRLLQFAQEQMMFDLLPVLDHAKQALAVKPDANEGTEKWITGVEHLLHSLRKVLNAQGLEEMKVIGKPFDPKQHESTGAQKVEGTKPGIVLEEARPGYLLHGEVLRPAKVIISE